MRRTRSIVTVDLERIRPAVSLTKLVFASALLLIACDVSFAAFSIGDPDKIVPSDGQSMDWFGGSLAIDGDRLVVGSQWHHGGGIGRGAAYVYKKNSTQWALQDILTASDAQSAGNFGNAVAIQGSTIVVGDYQHSLVSPSGSIRSAGAAYVFQETAVGWTETAKLVASDAAVDNQFGNAVAVHGNTAIVGGGSAAYVFESIEGTWHQQEKLLPSFADGFGLGGGFGNNIALESGFALVAASSQDAGSTNSGAVFAFTKKAAGWEETDILLPSSPLFRGSFGASIDVSGNTAIIGRPHGVPSTPLHPGAAYIFERNGDEWVQTALLQASDKVSGDFFGSEVAISGDFAAVAKLGTVYVFHRSNGVWAEIDKLTSGFPSDSDQFGVALAFDQQHLAVGARLDDQIGSDVGAAYIFTVPEPSVILLSGIGFIAVPRRRRQRLCLL